MKKYHLILCAAAITVPTACVNKSETERPEKISSVKTMEIAASQTTNRLYYVGTVEESLAVSLSFSGMGTVEQVFVSEGQRVSKGQLLATLNTATMQNSYDAAQAKLAQAQDAYDRLSKVHENGSLPDIKFIEVETGLQQAKSMAAITQKSLEDCKMYAPIKGVIAARNIEVGESAMPGTAAFKLVSVDKVNVKISIPENEIGNVQTGQTASISVSALNNAVFTGKIETKGIVANAISHTYEAKIGIDNNANAKNASPLLPGMVCKVTLAGADNTTAFVVPNRAIQVSPDGKRFVWLADGNVARRRLVETGDLTNNGIIVLKGLTAGDRIIVDGFRKISEGTRLNCDF